MPLFAAAAATLFFYFCFSAARIELCNLIYGVNTSALANTFYK